MDPTWRTGTTVSSRLRVLGLPFSRHRITVTAIDHEHHVMQSDERGEPFMVSFRHLAGRRIARDVSIVLRPSRDADAFG